jgi:hypothetical protein
MGVDVETGANVDVDVHTEGFNDVEVNVDFII